MTLCRFCSNEAILSVLPTEFCTIPGTEGWREEYCATCFTIYQDELDMHTVEFFKTVAN